MEAHNWESTWIKPETALAEKELREGQKAKVLAGNTDVEKEWI